MLWPDSEPLTGIPDLAARLQGAEVKFREWRHSSARSGADEALAWVLSWYENIRLDVLIEARGASRWLTDPVLIARRMQQAHAIAEYAKILDTEEEEEEEVPTTGSDAEYADSGTAGDGEEHVGEEIQMEVPPSRTVPESETPVDAPTETQAGAPDSGTEADAPIVEPQATAETAIPKAPTGTAESEIAVSGGDVLKLAADIASQAASDAAAMNPEAAA